MSTWEGILESRTSPRGRREPGRVWDGEEGRCGRSPGWWEMGWGGGVVRQGVWDLGGHSEESSLCHSAGAASTASSSQQPLGVGGREAGCVLVHRQGKGWAPEQWQHWGQVMESPPCPAPQHQHRWCLPMTQVSPGSWARSPQETHHSESLSLCMSAQPEAGL